MWKAPRSHDPLLGIVHVNVGPDREGGAQSVANFIQRQTGGYHEVIDNKEVIICAGDREMVAGAKGGRANRDGKHYCVIGYPQQSPAEWNDPFSAAAVVLCSHSIARDAVRYGWQVRRLSAAEVATNGVRGLCGHVDVTDAYNVRGGHWDPGPHFPWQRLVDLVSQQINQGTHTDPINGGLQVQPNDRMDAWRPKGSDAPVVLHADGGVFDHSGSHYFNSVPGVGGRLVMGVNHAVSILPTSTEQGYWILGADGGIFAFGDAVFHGNGVDLPKFGCQAVELQPNGNGYDILWECVAPGVVSAGSLKFAA